MDLILRHNSNRDQSRILIGGYETEPELGTILMPDRLCQKLEVLKPRKNLGQSKESGRLEQNFNKFWVCSQGRSFRASCPFFVAKMT